MIREIAFVLAAAAVAGCASNLTDPLATTAAAAGAGINGGLSGGTAAGPPVLVIPCDQSAAAGIDRTEMVVLPIVCN